MKITMYELLGLVKDGKAPKKIKYRNEVLYYDEKLKNYFNDEDMFPLFAGVNTILDEEVEILEEEPRDIEVCGSLFTKSEYDKLAHSEEEKKIPEKLEEKYYHDEPALIDDMAHKINEIIDCLDCLKSKGDE